MSIYLKNNKKIIFCRNIFFIELEVFSIQIRYSTKRIRGSETLITNLESVYDAVDVVEHLVDPGEESRRALALPQILPPAQLSLLLQLTCKTKQCNLKKCRR